MLYAQYIQHLMNIKRSLNQCCAVYMFVLYCTYYVLYYILCYIHNIYNIL